MPRDYQNAPPDMTRPPDTKTDAPSSGATGQAPPEQSTGGEGTAAPTEPVTPTDTATTTMPDTPPTTTT